jgi:hypothetical protein
VHRGEQLELVLSFGRAWIDPALAPKAFKVALVVGSILFIVNHGEAAIAHEMTNERWISALLTYLVPYTVSVHGQWLASRPTSSSKT